MKLKAKLMMFTAAVAFSASMAAAAITTDDVVRTYQTQGYSYVEVVEGPTQIKVEAIKDGVKLEVIYDKASGNVISQESGAAGDEADRTGVEVRQADHDFDDNGDDDSNDDNGDDDNGDDDNGDDDNSDDDGSDDDGSDDGAGHDQGDDHGDDSDGGDGDNGGSEDGGSDGNGGGDN